mgnify:CR=1 FL=1
MRVERLRRVTAKEPMERIRRSPEAPQGAFGVVDKSGLILADAAGDAAARFEAITKRRQDDWDRAKVNEAVSQYLRWDQETRYSPERGLMLTSGANAKGLYDRSVDLYMKQAQEMAGGLENDRQRAMFREAIIPHERAAAVSLSKHEATELRKWNVEQSEERLKNEAVAFSGCFDTPEGREAALAAARQVSFMINGDQGEETNARNEKAVLRQLVSYGLDSLVRSDPLRAEKMLESYKGEFDGVTYEKMRDVVGKAVLPVKAQAFAEEMLKKHGVDGASSAIAETREAFKGKDENVYLGYVNSLYADVKQARNEAREKIEAEAIDLLNNRVGYGKINAFLSKNEAALGPKRYRTLKNDLDSDYKVGKYADKPKRDEMAALRVWSRAEKELAAGVYADKDEFYDAYEDSGLKASELKSLANAAFKKKSGGKDHYNKYNPLTVVDKMTKDYNLELDPQEDKAFWTAFSAAAHAKEADLGRKLTDDEIEALAKERFKKEVVRREYNGIERGLMWLGVGVDYFTPDKVTEAYKYQTEAAMMGGVKYNAETNTYYTVDDAGNIKGWEPDSNPKLKGLDKRKIKNKGYYDEIDEIADDITR